MPDRCEYFTFSQEPDIVIGCENPQGEGPLFFFVSVPGRRDAVRVPVCEEHAALLSQNATTAHADRPGASDV